ncbi:hypothetical protein B447_17451 [Thauera sp. 27]|uniref:DUF1566 domain-containing protein n=1 Tax=Thauera sp. 27 TaxID=305700 RepID=UPI0002D07807|nr:DUF1566 domain-containing protein [Thauera sp. 27]ENO76552.1 hypothetical protein B447_17451 [Thauera sp. 27]
MTTITLDAVKAEQQRLANMIAALEAQALVQTFSLPATEITLQPGEHYAGIILGKDGEPDYRLILLPGEAGNVTWAQACEWATTAGGELPSRREQSLLFANLRDQFQPRWYWSGEQLATDSDFAWYQLFLNGNQDNNYKSYEGRARAVRRSVIH